MNKDTYKQRLDLVESELTKVLLQSLWDGDEFEFIDETLEVLTKVRLLKNKFLTETEVKTNENP